jgi:N-acetylglucosamine-6-phosphate deacetylase
MDADPSSRLRQSNLLPELKMRITGRNPSDGMSLEIIVQDGVIVSVCEAKHDDAAWLSAGLIDMQVNGYGGADLNAEGLEPQTVVELTKKMLALGVTTYLPTIITSSEQRITSALRAVAQARRLSKVVAETIPFVHLEGPHISDTDGFRGAHRTADVRPPELAEFLRWQDASGGLVGMITLSPHFSRVEEYIAAVTKRGVVVALGHTHAEPEQIRSAVDAGARVSTHLGNGIAASIDRHRNAIWTQLADDRLSAAMIADGHHLPADALKTFIRAKGVARSILVSDTVAIAGMPPGNYTTPVGGRVELETNGRLGLVGSGYLAGATLPLKDGVVHVCAATGISLADALSMATVNPGRFTNRRGLLEVGARADLIRFRIDDTSHTMHIESVMQGGRAVPIEN